MKTAQNSQNTYNPTIHTYSRIIDIVIHFQPKIATKWDVEYPKKYYKLFVLGYLEQSISLINLVGWIIRKCCCHYSLDSEFKTQEAAKRKKIENDPVLHRL